MRFVSWNVNGLRACLTKGFMESFRDMDADVFCLQETKMQEGQAILDLPGYKQFWNSAEKKGYSGTAIFTRVEPIDVTYGIGIEEHDHEGRVITMEFENYYLVTVYTPNSQKELARLAYRMTWEEAFKDYVCGLDKKKPVIICGDMNVAHEAIDLKNPKSNENNAGYTPQERSAMTRLLSCGITDTFRYLHPDAVGCYSWWSYMFHARENNAGWRIDYFLVSDRIRNRIREASIASDIMGSDHCPVILELDF
ncbi:MAG: exodeoxyribonuclease III [Anaerovibrio sp.]|nr:exodeoxyribonuclease III [Anaerovibrio sp.]